MAVRQQQRQQQATETGYASSTGPEIHFREGLMHVHGQPQRPVQALHFESSNGLTQYTTVEWVDPITGVSRTSCNCAGWTVKKKDKARGCCHTRELETGVGCGKRRIDQVAIQTVSQAVSAIPELKAGRELRGLML